jgi:hypothetical protein
VGLALFLLSAVHHRHAHARPNPHFWPTRPRRRYAPHTLAHGAPHGRSPEMRTQSSQWLMCAHAALHSGTFHPAGRFPAPRSASPRCPRAIATRPGRPLHGPRLGAPVCGESAPACPHSPCSRHHSLTPGSASGVLFARARRGATTPSRRRPFRRSVQPVHW